MQWNMGWNKGVTRLSPAEYVPLVVRILNNRHVQDVVERAADVFGTVKADRLGPADLTRNMLLSWCYRYCRTYDRPPLVSGLTEGMAAVCGDRSASTTVERYAEAGGRPMPTTVVQASKEAQRYEQCAGYAAVRLGWSERSQRLLFQVITPDDIQCEYAADDPTEPTVIKHRATRVVDGKPIEVVEVYDLTDLEDPQYRISQWDADGTAAWEGREGASLTAAVLGEEAGDAVSGDAYKAFWSYADGTPYHPIVVRGHPDRMYQRLQAVEASLIVPARWTNWGTGCDLSSHPRTHAIGLSYVGQSSNTGTKGQGSSDGPEVIHRWEHTNPEQPGELEQHGPSFDPEVTARAIARYEAGVLSSLDHSVDMSGTGGEPTAREAEAQEEAIVMMFPESRRFDSELLSRAAALANRAAEVDGSDFPEGPFGLLYRGEVTEALEGAEAEAPAADVPDPTDPSTGDEDE